METDKEGHRKLTRRIGLTSVHDPLSNDGPKFGQYILMLIGHHLGTVLAIERYFTGHSFRVLDQNHGSSYQGSLGPSTGERIKSGDQGI